MKIFVLFALALGVANAAESSAVKVVAPCDVFADPLAFRDAELEMTAQIEIEFEGSVLVCETFRPRDFLGIWLDWDLSAIAKSSPTYAGFATTAARAVTPGGRRRFRGELHFRGRFEVSDKFLNFGPKEVPRRVGFGHISAFGFRVVVLQVIDYKPNTSVTSPAAQEPRQP